MFHRTIKPTNTTDAKAAAACDADPARTQVISVTGDMRNTAVIRRLEQAAIQYVRPGRRRVVLDLEGVEAADTRLLPEIITIVRRASAAGVAWQIRASKRIRDWISIYKLDRLLQPANEVEANPSAGA